MNRDSNPSNPIQKRELKKVVNHQDKHRERNQSLSADKGQVVGKANNQSKHTFQSVQVFPMNKSYILEGDNLGQGFQEQLQSWENNVASNSLGLPNQEDDTANQDPTNGLSLNEQHVERLRNRVQQRNSSPRMSQDVPENCLGDKFEHSNRLQVEKATKYSDIFKKIQSRLDKRRVRLQQGLDNFFVTGRGKCMQVHEQNMKLGSKIEQKVRETSNLRKSIQKINEVFSSTPVPSFQQPEDRNQSPF